MLYFSTTLFTSNQCYKKLHYVNSKLNFLICIQLAVKSAKGKKQNWDLPAHR